MNGSGNGSSTGDSLGERAGSNHLKLWIFMLVNRWVLVSGLAAGIFATLILAGTFGPAAATWLLWYQDPIDTIFQGLISGIITGVALVLTISQLIISQQLGPLGQQRDRYEGSLKFREDMEESTSLAVSPSHPSKFLEALVEAARRQALGLEDSLSATVEMDVRDEILGTIDSIVEDAEKTKEQLSDAQFGTFSVLNAAFVFNNSQKIHSLRRFRNIYADSLPAETTEQMDNLLDVLELFSPARENIKTLYFQWELSNLSWNIIYTAIPALLTTYIMVLFVEPDTISGGVFGVSYVLWIVSLGVTIGTLPFLVLVAYIARLSTVAKRTAAIGPFVLQTTDIDEEIEWMDDLE